LHRAAQLWARQLPQYGTFSIIGETAKKVNQILELNQGNSI